MAWLQVRLSTGPERAPLIEAALASAGALAVTLDDAGDDPQLEPPPGALPLWGMVRVTALFPDEAGVRERVEVLADQLAAALTVAPVIERLEDRPWERAWLADFRPTRFGTRLWVCPRAQAPEDARAVVVELDPGLAFGTGHHATTALCLEWLDGAELTGRTLIDYGCGSGILAIAALRLGAEGALAVDHDPQALEATRENAAANGVADRLLVCAPADLMNAPAEILVANILAAPLIELAPRFARLVRHGGQIALSGLLADQIDAVSAAYQADFALDPPREREDWILLSGRRLATG
jgi:ribosomal protein L11 methyltransferase